VNRSGYTCIQTRPKDYRVEVSQLEAKSPQTQSNMFNDEDMFLRNKKHNRLLMFGEIDDLPINLIMIDGG
jgi:hypothetical protein